MLLSSSATDGVIGGDSDDFIGRYSQVGSVHLSLLGFMGLSVGILMTLF